MSTPRLCILYTGGTIGMRRTPHGYAPAPGYLAAQLAAISPLQSAALPDYDLVELEPLLDSANMLPAEFSHASDQALRFIASDLPHAELLGAHGRQRDFGDELKAITAREWSVSVEANGERNILHVVAIALDGAS